MKELLVGAKYRIKNTSYYGKLVSYDSTTGEAIIEDNKFRLITTNAEAVVRFNNSDFSYCDRCGKENPRALSGSFFNEDICCMECIEMEERHELYSIARYIENKEVKKGNMNFEGIGLPRDLIPGDWTDMSEYDEEAYKALSEKYKKDGIIK